MAPKKPIYRDLKIKDFLKLVFLRWHRWGSFLHIDTCKYWGAEESLRLSEHCKAWRVKQGFFYRRLSRITARIIKEYGRHSIRQKIMKTLWQGNGMNKCPPKEPVCGVRVACKLKWINEWRMRSQTWFLFLMKGMIWNSYLTPKLLQKITFELLMQLLLHASW